MRITAVYYHHDRDEPRAIDCTLTTVEAALIARLFGGFTDVGITAVAGEPYCAAKSELYDELVGVFNRHWDDGLDGFVQRFDARSILAAEAK